jgi:hypothetical protein
MCISTFETIDDKDNISIKYTNLYAINGIITYVTTDKNIDLPYVNKWTNTYYWSPDIKFFETKQEIENLCQNAKVVELALLGDNLWYGNVGHALFDGLYPVYLAAVKFGYKDEPFLYMADNWTNPLVTANEAVIRFSKYSEIWSYPKLDKNTVIHFKTLISGTGQTGNRVINKDYILYGSKYNGLEAFKQRMMLTCGAIPNKPLNHPINAIIINNKRYTDKERQVINQVIEHYNLREHVNIKLIDWPDYKSFSQQMKLLQDIDIHISGPGTGMLYMPFLKNGAVNINLGYIEHTQTNTARPNIKILNSKKEDYLVPGWMEQSVCAAVKNVSTLYYDRFNYNLLEYISLIEIIEKAIQLVKNKEVLDNKHNIDAQVFIEYCKRVQNAEQVCNYLTDIAFFIELFVNEHPQAVPENIVDINLLRKIKDEFNMNRSYEIK